jgi:poly-beta-1,6-N-acetyl-D-glucosamine synthase
MVWFISSVFMAYFALLLGLLFGWRKAVRNMQVQPIPVDNDVSVSVVVAARNEEHFIGRLIEALRSQTYTAFDVIIVDDHSTDNTVASALEAAADDSRFTVVRQTGTGKKQALTYGIQRARGNVIVTTDADCVMSSHWLASLAGVFRSDHIQMVAAPVRMISNGSFFQELQQLEFASLTGSAGATLSIGWPTLCNGANLAFRKAAFHEVGGYEDNLHIPSGDDEFMMRKIAARYPGSVFFLADRHALVSSPALIALRDFFNQRVRWAGKWRYNPSFTTRLLAMAVLLVQLLVLVCIAGIAVGWHALICTMWLGIRLILEGIYLHTITVFLQTRFNLWAFLVLQVCYPLYVVTIGIISFFAPYRWKGRKWLPIPGLFKA